MGKEHPALTYAAVEFPSALKTRAMLDSGSSINTITRKVAEQIKLKIIPKFAQFATAAGNKDIIEEIHTNMTSQKYSGAISLTVCGDHPVGHRKSTPEVYFSGFFSSKI